MRTNIIIILSMFVLMGFTEYLNTPSEIYYGRKGPWYVYWDSRKEIEIVEVGGIKYGYLDILKNTGKKDTVALSNVGLLLFQNGYYYYKSKNLKLKLRLEKQNYNEKIDAKRSKLFNIDAFMKIRALEEKFGNKYSINNNEIYQDYIYFRDNVKLLLDYQPSYILRFYNEIDSSYKE